MHPIPRRKFLSLLPALGLAGCGASPAAPLRVATFVWPGYEPLFLARSLGYFDGHRIQLLEFPSAAECILAFQNRVVDAITLTLDEIIRLAHAGHEPRVVLLLDFSNGADVILARPEFPTLAHIKGRTVGVERDTLGAFVLSRALETCGLSSTDVKIASHRVDRLEGEFKERRIDAVVTYEPYRTRLLADGAKQIFDSSQLPGEITDALMVRRSAMENPAPALRALAEGWFKAVEYAAAQPEDAARRMAPREQVTPAEFLNSLRLVHLVNRTENRDFLTNKDSPLPAVLRRLAAFLAKTGLLPTIVDTAHLLDPGLVAATPR
jgi:NitT/TauT family transport system substrate-binding protein